MITVEERHSEQPPLMNPCASQYRENKNLPEIKNEDSNSFYCATSMNMSLPTFLIQPLPFSFNFIKTSIYFLYYIFYFIYFYMYYFYSGRMTE